jgi:ribosome biogenesis protein BRX1
MHKCRYFLYFESKKKIRFSLWVGRFPEGPSIKFDIDGIVHVRDIKFQGNCVKGGRHILSFDEGFDCIPQMKIAKELMIGALNVPAFHPKSTAVFDHSLSFISDGN